MSISTRVLSTYSADLFGMCSALYELGGLVIMHDASGCNSTYCTHDEPRWFDMDSMIYISALTEEDVVMGRDERLIEDAVNAVKEVKEAKERGVGKMPRFIAIGGSPMPFMVGCDMEGVAKAISNRTGLPVLGLECGGIKDYTAGAGAALSWLSDTFCAKALPPNCSKLQQDKKHSILHEIYGENLSSPPILVNVLGLTPLDFSITGNDKALLNFLRNNGARVISSWAMGTSIEDIEKAGYADVNIVVSAVGLPAAKRLNSLYGTPYVTGIPIGGYSKRFMDEVRTAAESNAFTGREGEYKREDSNAGEASYRRLEHFFNIASSSLDGTLIIGEAVFAHSLRNCLEMDFYAKRVKVLCPLGETCGLLREGDINTDDEERIIETISNASTVIADPIYRRALPAFNAPHFIDFPHTAYSGRIWQDKIPLFIG